MEKVSLFLKENQTMDIVLGEFITGEARKDAIHVAIAPVTAGEQLIAGEHVSVVNGMARPSRASDKVGIVDPFIKGPIVPGRRIWVLLYPGTVSSLRHEWDHPSFVAPKVIDSEYAEVEEDEEDDGCKGC